jgi:hypothetical protein
VELLKRVYGSMRKYEGYLSPSGKAARKALFAAFVLQRSCYNFSRDKLRVLFVAEWCAKTTICD